MKKIIACAASLLLLAGCGSSKLSLEQIGKALNSETAAKIFDVVVPMLQQVNAQKDQSVMIGNTKVTAKGDNPGFTFNYGGAQRVNGEVVVVFEFVNSTQTTFPSLTMSPLGNVNETCYAIDANGNSYGNVDVFLIDTRKSESITVKNVVPEQGVLAAIYIPNVPESVKTIPTVHIGAYAQAAAGAAVSNFSYTLENVEIE